MTTKTAFLAQTYTLNNHVPSVDLGAFDLFVDPKKGKLEITVKVHLITGNPVTQTKLTKFGSEFVKLVPQVWDKKAKFVCTKTGFDGIELKPTFKVEVVGLGSAHYQINVIDEQATDHAYAPIAVVKPTTFTGPGTDPNFAPRVGEFGALSNQSKGEIESYRRDILHELSAGKLIALKGSPTQDPSGRQHLEKFAREIMALKVPRKFKSSQRPTLTVKGCGPGDRQKLAAGAAGWLCACGVKNPIVEQSDGDTAKASSVHLAFSKTELTTMFPKKTASQSSRFQQTTVAHEFGHMLGLPDEYCCMGALTPDAMQDVYAMTAPEIESFTGHSTKKLADIKQMPDGTVNVPHIVRHQAAFVRLCGTASLPAPDFGTISPSLMSAGMVFHPHHFATLWEAIGRATGVDEWRVVLES